MWEHSSERYSRHSNAHMALNYANWNTDDYISKSTIALPEIRDPFLDSRVVEYLFSIPSLPWFYKKHILRASMKTVLPPEIINRPKTPIGNLSYIYLNQPQNEWVDNWTAQPKLLNYIDFKKIPNLSKGASGEIGSYLNLRPLYLNLWMNNIINITN